MIRYDVPIDEYHASQHAISKSGLDDIERSPAMFYALHLDPQRPPRPGPTPAMMLGTLVHCAVLEPSELNRRYATAPICDRRTTAGKALYADFMKTLQPGQQVIAPDEYVRAVSMAVSLTKIAPLREALATGQPEVSAYWTDEGTGAACRCRPDWVSPAGDGVILVDVKTTTDASPRGFAKAIANYRYDVQAAYYTDGYAAASGHPVYGFVFAAVEKEWPFAAAAYMLTDEDLAIGRMKYRRNLASYVECLAANQWPGYSEDIQLLQLPVWAKD